MEKIAPYYKAVVACLVAALTAAGTALADGSITPQEWIVIIIAFLGGGGITYAVPNRGSNNGSSSNTVDRRTIDQQTKDATGLTDI